MRKESFHPSCSLMWQWRIEGLRDCQPNKHQFSWEYMAGQCLAEGYRNRDSAALWVGPWNSEMTSLYRLPFWVLAEFILEREVHMRMRQCTLVISHRRPCQVHSVCCNHGWLQKARSRIHCHSTTAMLLLVMIRKKYSLTSRLYCS